MFRRYDWECQRCGAWFERLVSYPEGDPRPKTLGDVEDENLNCPSCGNDATEAVCLLSNPAEYHGERDLSPAVMGGRFDTLGRKQVSRPADLPLLPDKASYEQARAHVTSPMYREWKSEVKATRKENAAKQARASARARGENVNFRRDRLPGDPKLTS